MKTTLYRDNTTLRWILFEDRVAPRHQRQLPDGVDRCVCMLQPARTAIDGVSYMASCRTAMSRGQRRVFESHARQMEQDDRFVSGVLTAQSCDNLLHCDVEPNASSDIMIVSDVDLPSKPSSKYIVTSHSLQPESSTQPSPTSDSVFCTAHALLETCCHMKAKLLILTIAYPNAWGVLLHVELCNVSHTLAEHGIDFVYYKPCRVSSQYNLPRDFHHSECRGYLPVYSTSSRIVQRTLDWGRHREWSFALFSIVDVGNPSYWADASTVGHLSSTVLVQLLRVARALPEYIQACRHFRCDACEDNKPKHQSTKVALPKEHVFGRNLGIDVLEIKDNAYEP